MAIRTVATTSWPKLTIISRPPHCMNVEIVSTSLVTRETSEPRRSAFWVSTDRSCTCRNARTRRVARPPSVVRNSRTFSRYAANAVRIVASPASSTALRTRLRSAPSGPIRPSSMVCCTAIGTSTRPTVAPNASSSVTGSPARNSGDSARPRLSVAQAPCWGRPESVIVAMSALHSAAPPRRSRGRGARALPACTLGRTGRLARYSGCPMSGQDASSERRHDFFTHDPALDEDLDGWHDAPEPSWLSDDETDAGNEATAHIPAYDLGPATESFVVDLTGPQAMVGSVEPSRRHGVVRRGEPTPPCPGTPRRPQPAPAGSARRLRRRPRRARRAAPPTEAAAPPPVFVRTPAAERRPSSTSRRSPRAARPTRPRRSPRRRSCGPGRRGRRAAGARAC